MHTEHHYYENTASYKMNSIGTNSITFSSFLPKWQGQSDELKMRGEGSKKQKLNLTEVMVELLSSHSHIQIASHQGCKYLSQEELNQINLRKRALNIQSPINPYGL